MQMSKHRRPQKPEAKGASGQRFGITVTAIYVGSWCPTPDGSGPAEAVMLQIMTNQKDLSFCLRLKEPAAVDEIIGMLRTHQRHVWPDYEPEPEGKGEG